MNTLKYDIAFAPINKRLILISDQLGQLLKKKGISSTILRTSIIGYDHNGWGDLSIKDNIKTKVTQIKEINYKTHSNFLSYSYRVMKSRMSMKKSYEPNFKCLILFMDDYGEAEVFVPLMKEKKIPIILFQEGFFVKEKKYEFDLYSFGKYISIYSCCFAVCSHGDTVVAHDLLRESPASFDTPAGQEFQKTNDITCIRGCWKPALKITAFPLVAQIVHQVYPLTATSSLACINFHTALSCLSIASVAYLGGSHRKRMIEAHGLREPPCNLGCCALSPPFNPYCCWFWCVPCAAAQEHKAMKRMLRRRASDVTHDRL